MLYCVFYCMYQVYYCNRVKYILSVLVAVVAFFLRRQWRYFCIQHILAVRAIFEARWESVWGWPRSPSCSPSGPLGSLEVRVGLAAAAYFQSVLFWWFVGSPCGVGCGHLLATRAALENRLESMWGWLRPLTCSPGYP